MKWGGGAYNNIELQGWLYVQLSSAEMNEWRALVHQLYPGYPHPHMSRGGIPAGSLKCFTVLTDHKYPSLSRIHTATPAMRALRIFHP